MTQLRHIVATRIKQCRKEKGWTIEETAKALSDAAGERIIGSRYSNWEQELRMPSPEQVVIMATVFGKPAAWIQGFSDNDSLNPVSARYITATAPQLTTRSGVIATPQLCESSAYSLDYLERRNLNKNKVLSIRAIDNSMAGLIEEGDEVLLNREVTSVSGADLYGVLVNGVIWLRWIRPQLDGSYIISADNSAQYPEQVMSGEQLQQLEIVGRVARISHDR